LRGCGPAGCGRARLKPLRPQVSNRFFHPLSLCEEPPAKVHPSESYQ